MGGGYLRYGAVAAPHGMQGALYIFPHSGDPSALYTLKQLWLGDDPTQAVPYTLKSARPFKKGALANLVEVADRTAAEALKGVPVWVLRDDLPPLEEGEWYLEDLRGAVVRDAAGIQIGTVEDFQQSAGGTLFVINRGNRTILIPWVEAFVERISPEGEVLLTERAPIDL